MMSEKATTAIMLRQVTIAYQHKSILDGLNISLSASGISFIIGENGAGKTQLLRLIHGLIPAHSGQVLAPDKNRQAFLQQSPILLNRNVLENLRFIRGTSVCPAPHFDHQLTAIIQQFDLQDLLTQNVHTLSGGQQKRVALARLFLQQADCYLFDEPNANIDYQSSRLIETAINTLIKENKKVLLTTHDFFQIQRLFQVGRDEIFILKKGQLIDHLTQPNVAQLNNYFL